MLFKDLDLKVGPFERYGILGPNGAGKSTLLKILAQKIEPSFGQIIVGKNTKVVEFDQHREQLDRNETLKEALAEHGDYVFVGDQRIHIASYLERYLFDPGDANRKIGSLSGGEQNRLLLAKLFRSDANCLLLDEPTNDLDVTSLAVLEDILLDYEGVVFAVSHDRRFLDKICTHIISFQEAPLGFGAESRVVVYAGNYSMYEILRAQAPLPEKIPDIKNPATTKSERVRVKSRRSYKEEQEFLGMEKQIELLEAEREALNAELSAGQSSKGMKHLNQKAERLNVLEQEIEKLYARWQELADLSEKL